MKKVLIVEDDDDIRMVLNEFLAEEGYEVHLACHGKEALERLETGRQKPDVILLDLMMPVMNGETFKEIVRADERLCKIPIIVMTADARVIHDPASIGAEGFVRKPIDLDKLLRTIATV